MPTFEADALLRDPEQPVCGVNITIAWPLPRGFRSAFENTMRQLRNLAEPVFLYPFPQTHITVLTAVSFKEQVNPSTETVRQLEQAADALADDMAPTLRGMQPFVLDAGSPVLVPQAAFLPFRNETGEVRTIRQQALAFCLRSGGLLAGARVPQAIHSTILRFHAPPEDPGKFAADFERITATLQLGRATINEVLITLETQPYMRQGRVARALKLASESQLGA